MSNPYPHFGSNKVVTQVGIAMRESGKGCGHGKLFTEYCKECEIFDTERMLHDAQRRVVSLTKRLEELRNDSD